MFRSLRRRVLMATVVTGMALTAVSSQQVFADTPDATPATTAAPAPMPQPADVCGDTRPDHFRCLSQVLPGSRTKRAATATPDGAASLPVGLGPNDIQSAYGLASAIAAGQGKGKTVALVDAYDDPTAEADLAVYRSTYGLPPCTTANGCFRKVNQRGQASPLPEVNGDWAVEITLDLDAVSAACPACDILLVEADSSSVDDLPTGVDTAVALGADAVSNSYGLLESGITEAAAGKHYDHPGVAITVSSGDGAYSLGASFPANQSTVITVGGTALTRADNKRGWSETAWAANAKNQGAGAGCSAYVDKPAWQHDKDCPGRMTADVSAVADPQTGLAIYDSTQPVTIPLSPGWMRIGGTSLASPLIAGMYALAGHTDKVRDASGLYAHRDDLNDVVGGSTSRPGDGQECPTTSYLCTAVRGYDGPTGLGTPNGLGAF
jgi:subtilase family serine protease